MTSARSRAYKLQLSAEGIQLFLRCHDRLCRQVGDLLSYGMTLHVAVTLMAWASAEDVSAALLDPALKGNGGQMVRYVGASPQLWLIVAGIALRAESHELIFPAPKVWTIFLAALAIMESAGGKTLLHAYQMTKVSVEASRSS